MDTGTRHCAATGLAVVCLHPIIGCQAEAQGTLLERARTPAYASCST
jgi:hypothetical protein